MYHHSHRIYRHQIIWPMAMNSRCLQHQGLQMTQVYGPHSVHQTLCHQRVWWGEEDQYFLIAL